MLPWLLGFFVLTMGPMVASLYLSFTDYDLFEANWIGLDNYTALFADPRFLKSVQVTVTYVLVSTPVKLVAALLVAMLLNAKRKGLGFYRSAFYAPSLVAASVS
ncbi:carbohydrate ABC transporter permease, partial [Pseudactinotalea sp.]|uniref:carbohydrate ABC transporter permease n=1 Tax=Pseudactinotalea sp. TaxID=1926260 RepID=UPI003B3A24A7